jgi:CheY-like chemotaxis protein
MARDALEGAGYHVTLAVNGDAALAALETSRFDLVVLDIAMPGISGFDVLAYIRKSPSLVDLPVLVITGNDDAASIECAFDHGATSFLVKPLNWLLFIHHVQFVQKAARTQADLRQANRTAEFMSDLKSRLVGTLVTEFQSPLRSAIGFARLLKEEADGPIASVHYRAWIGDLHTAVERLGATHLKMLNFGRSLAEGIVLTNEPVEVGPLIVGVLQAVGTVASRRQLTLSLVDQLPPGLRLLGDSVLLAQALRGVIDNAVRLSHRKSTIAVETDLTPQGDIVIRVTDSSPALSQPQIDEIFGLRPFAPTKAEAVETSTGLKLTRILIEAHDGRLRIDTSRSDALVTELHLPAQRRLGEQIAETTSARLRDVSAQLQSALKAGRPVAQVVPLRSGLA